MQGVRSQRPRQLVPDQPGRAALLPPPLPHVHPRGRSRHAHGSPHPASRGGRLSVFNLEISHKYVEKHSTNLDMSKKALVKKISMLKSNYVEAGREQPSYKILILYTYII